MTQSAKTSAQKGVDGQPELKQEPRAPSRLKVNGQPLILHPMPPQAARIAEYLQALPDDELKLTDDICRETGASMRTLRGGDYTSFLSDFRQHVTTINKVLWGNPRAIAELRRQLGTK